MPLSRQLAILQAWVLSHSNKIRWFNIPPIVLAIWANHQIFDPPTFQLHYIYIYILYTYKFSRHVAKFWGCHKSSILAILFSRITKYPALWFMQVKVCQWNFKDENFTKAWKLHPSKICTYTVYIYIYILAIEQSLQYSSSS